MENMIRIELHFANSDTPFPNGVWVSVDRGLLSTINDFKCFLSRKFRFLDHRNMNLYVKKCLLPDDETILILRDEDIIRVACEEKFSFCDYCHNGSEEKMNYKGKSHENLLNSKRKTDGEFYAVAKRQKLLSPSVLLCSTRSDSEASCNSNNSVSMSINNHQEEISDLKTYTMKNSRKHKGKKKKSKRSKRDYVPQNIVASVDDVNCDARENIVDTVCEVNRNVLENTETHGVSEHKSRKTDKKKKETSQSSEDANAIVMNQEIRVNHSLLALSCMETKIEEINESSPVKLSTQTSSKVNSGENAKQESPAKLNSPILSHTDDNKNANEAEKDATIELKSQSPLKGNLNTSSGNNCHKRKRKRRRRRKTDGSLITNDCSLNDSIQGVTSSVPKVSGDLQIFQPILKHFGLNANIPVPKHTFFDEALDDHSSSPLCEQSSDVSKSLSCLEEPNKILSDTVMNHSTQKQAVTFSQVPESENVVQQTTFDDNVTFSESTSIVVPEQLDKNLENGMHAIIPIIPLPDNQKKSYSDYPPLKSFPSVGSIIAYKILELSSSYCPEVSDYKEGRIVNTHDNDLEIELTNVEIIAREGKFENIYPDQNPEHQILKKVIVNWAALIEPRLIYQGDGSNEKVPYTDDLIKSFPQC